MRSKKMKDNNDNEKSNVIVDGKSVQSSAIKNSNKKAKTTKSSVSKTKNSTNKPRVNKSTTKKTNKTKSSKINNSKSKNKKTNSKKKNVKNNSNKRIEEIEFEKYKRRNKIITISLLFIIILVIIAILIYKYFFIAPTITIKDTYIDENENVVVKFRRNSFSIKNNVYCLYTTNDKKPSIDDANWKITSYNKCEYKLDENVYYLYLKNEDDKIYRAYDTNKLGLVKNIKINIDKSYLPVKDTLKLIVSYDKLGNVDEDIEWTSSNVKVASVENGIVTGKSNGTTRIDAKIVNTTVSSNIEVSNLIVKRPTNGFDFKKDELECDTYSKSQNDKLDEILKNKIEKVGYKTRAGVVEAARFLTLDFPYRINYFYENGRLTGNGYDGEGRYYHKGLYLNDSRFSKLEKSRKSPKTWGCSLFSVPERKYNENGLDCSGFVSWTLLNGGYDPGDIGAGITKVKDLTDLGELVKLNKKISESDTIKVGDLLHNDWSSGHIAIIVGIDKNYYYVAQAVWFDDVGVIINKYKKDKLSDTFDEVVLMDKYYKNDGELTNMW